jgi:hypothetical protein
MVSQSGKNQLTNQAFNQCLQNKKIFLFPKAKGLAQKELKIAQDDLAEAKDRFKNAKYKYPTINAYYAVFHASRALLYSKGYRIGKYPPGPIALGLSRPRCILRSLGILEEQRGRFSSPVSTLFCFVRHCIFQESACWKSPEPRTELRYDS